MWEMWTYRNRHVETIGDFQTFYYTHRFHRKLSHTTNLQDKGLSSRVCPVIPGWIRPTLATQTSVLQRRANVHVDLLWCHDSWTKLKRDNASCRFWPVAELSYRTEWLSRLIRSLYTCERPAVMLQPDKQRRPSKGFEMSCHTSKYRPWCFSPNPFVEHLVSDKPL